MKRNIVLFALIMIIGLSVSGCILGGDDEVVTTTPAPTTQAPTTPAPTTQAPTTPAPTTQAPTTPAPTTPAPDYFDTKVIGVSDVDGGFNVTVDKVGYYTHPKYGAAGAMTTHFRVDLTIENLINTTMSIYPNINCYIVDDQNERWPVYFIGSPTYLSGEYSGLETRQGYVVFDEINEDSTSNVFTIEIPTANLPRKIEISFEYP